MLPAISRSSATCQLVVSDRGHFIATTLSGGSAASSHLSSRGRHPGAVAPGVLSFYTGLAMEQDHHHECLDCGDVWLCVSDCVPL